jgi:PAS domain S-box-containing protein
LEADNAGLRVRLSEAEEMVRAIQQGAVDAFVLEELGRHRVYTLEGSDRPYRLFVEQMQQGVATLHSDGTIVYCNRRLTDLLKVTYEELIGGSLAPFIVEEDRPFYEHLMLQGRTRTGRGEARLRQSDGGVIPAYFTFSALPGDCAGMIGAFVTDLTTQKHHEQLAAAQEALRDADRRKDEFLAMLAHELRGPLAPLGNMLEVMKRAESDPAVVEQARATMERQLGQLVRLVDDLLDVSRITRNKLELRKERVDLASILRRVVETAGPQIRSGDHHVTLTLPPQPIELDADPARLTQVFQNVFNNACKYTEPGGHIGVIAELAGAAEKPSEVIVTIKDSGVGIPTDRLGSIFEPFIQVDRSLERTQGGLGIGLTLVKRLVEMHGGTVKATSDGLGRGSQFEVLLPLRVEAERAVDTLIVTTPAPAAAARRFLVVDDNADSASSLAMLLSIEGNETHTAHDGLEALEVAEQLRPEVVLLDIGLPKLNGFDTAKRIREQPWGKGIALVALTGWGQEEDRRRSKHAGFDGHLVKPVDFDELMKLLGSLRPEAH